MRGSGFWFGALIGETLKILLAMAALCVLGYVFCRLGWRKEPDYEIAVLVVLVVEVAQLRVCLDRLTAHR